MAANNTGGGTGGIQQNTIELLAATPLLREATIALFDFGFHAQPFQVVIDAGKTLFINVHRHDLSLGSDLQNMRRLAARRSAEIKNALAVFRLQIAHAALGRGILNGYPSFGKTRQRMDRGRGGQTHGVGIVRVGETF